MIEHSIPIFKYIHYNNYLFNYILYVFIRLNVFSLLKIIEGFYSKCMCMNLIEYYWSKDYLEEHSNYNNTGAFSTDKYLH